MMRRLVYVLPLLAVALVAVVGPLTQSTALTIAAVVMAVTPFVLKYVKLGGPVMAILSFAVAAVVTVAAGLVSGELKQADFITVNLYATMGALWAIQQGVFQLFKDNGTFGKYLV